MKNEREMFRITNDYKEHQEKDYLRETFANAMGQACKSLSINRGAASYINPCGLGLTAVLFLPRFNRSTEIETEEAN